jgi:hypothetical protein
LTGEVRPGNLTSVPVRLLGILLPARAFLGIASSRRFLRAFVLVFFAAFTTAYAQTAVDSFTLINADSDQPVAGYDPIPDGAVLNYATLPTLNLNIRANTTPAVVGSVKFSRKSVTSTSNFTENTAPYAAWGDTSGNYKVHVFDMGVYTYSATPYSAANASGTAGSAQTVHFNVINTAARIAISCDGNYHDRDDITSSALEIAQLAKAQFQSHLVCFIYADHYWLSTPSWESDMQSSVVNTANQWGGFTSGIFYDGTLQHDTAVSTLTAEINKSTGSDRLIILGLGPMEIIGQAVAAANTSARPYVTLVSHSSWNNTHATGSGPGEGLTGTAYSFKSIGSLGARLCQIPFESVLNSAPYSAFYWMRDSSDSKLQWLYARGQTAGKSTFDCSDSGVVYFVLTGDQDATPVKYQAMLGP